MAALFCMRNSHRRALLSLAFLVGRPASSSLAFTPPPSTNNRSFASTSTTTSLTMTKKVLVPIGEDSEEIETTCITDTLTRFGAQVTVASVKPNGELVCKMSRGIKVTTYGYHAFCFYIIILNLI
jgi:hypothetical protein